ncbi:MAG: YceD family protein [Stenomitos frigidus ULC029]
MDAIYIPQLTKAPQQTEVIDFSEAIPGLETLTPVQGQLRVTHQGSYLEVSANAETIVTLVCHRCLQQYNYRLSIAPSELIWLDETPDLAEALPLDQDIDPEDLVETLPPKGHFEPATWLYEQLCLELPQRQLCDQTCTGIELSGTNTPPPSVDRRWASLESLKNQLRN